MKNLKHERIIELCKYLGFESQIVYGLPYKHSTDAKERLRYLLWLTEISEWIYQTHDIQFFFEDDAFALNSLEYQIHRVLKELKEDKEAQKKTLKLL